MGPKELLKSFSFCFLPAMILFIGQTVRAQEAPATQMVPDTANLAYNEISQKLGFYVFPGNDETQAQQKADEYECYQWAIEQSGIDPLNLPTVEAPPPQAGPSGGAVKGAAKGAAVGAAVGGITGDAGEGAAVGATLGAVKGRRAGKQAQAQQNQQAQANTAAEEEAMKDSYKKAFSVCIEGKGYTIK